jgi:hypothetical protein
MTPSHPKAKSAVGTKSNVHRNGDVKIGTTEPGLNILPGDKVAISAQLLDKLHKASSERRKS